MIISAYWNQASKQVVQYSHNMSVNSCTQKSQNKWVSMTSWVARTFKRIYGWNHHYNTLWNNQKFKLKAKTIWLDSIVLNDNGKTIAKCTWRIKTHSITLGYHPRWKSTSYFQTRKYINFTRMNNHFQINEELSWS